VSDLTHKAFFGDAEYELRLTPILIAELERSTGCGIGGLCQRVFNNVFEYRDISEVIRLALVGGGTDPKKAADLVNTYVPSRPLIYAHALAVDVLQIVWFGKQNDDDSET